MSVRAKFKVDEFKSCIQQRKKDPNGNYDQANLENVEMRTVVMSAVYANGDPNHENTKFWNATPQAKIELGVINPEAWKAFELGKEVYVDFTPVE